MYKVEYEFLHYLCFTCGKIGHRSDLCREVNTSVNSPANGHPEMVARAVSAVGTDMSAGNGRNEGPSGRNVEVNMVTGQERSNDPEKFGPWMLVQNKNRKKNANGAHKRNEAQKQKTSQNRFNLFFNASMTTDSKKGKRKINSVEPLGGPVADPCTSTVNFSKSNTYYIPISNCANITNPLASNQDHYQTSEVDVGTQRDGSTASPTDHAISKGHLETTTNGKIGTNLASQLDHSKSISITTITDNNPTLTPPLPFHNRIPNPKKICHEVFHYFIWRNQNMSLIWHHIIQSHLLDGVKGKLSLTNCKKDPNEGARTDGICR
ncbi:hypothetical protein LguiA_021441 [Lonicera macranthoides]